jgi:hypothetical protein
VAAPVGRVAVRAAVLEVVVAAAVAVDVEGVD